MKYHNFWSIFIVIMDQDLDKLSNTSVRLCCYETFLNKSRYHSSKFYGSHSPKCDKWVIEHWPEEISCSWLAQCSVVSATVSVNSLGGNSGKPKVEHNVGDVAHAHNLVDSSSIGSFVGNDLKVLWNPSPQMKDITKVHNLICHQACCIPYS